MKRVAALTDATLKQFLRDKRSILLLLLSPLLLILLVFLSFDPSGLKTVPAGIVIDAPAFQHSGYDEEYLTYLDLSQYALIDNCLSSLRSYEEYVCIHITGIDPLTFFVYYDNTREPIIWEVLERIKQSFSLMQAQASAQMTSEFIESFGSRTDDVQRYQGFIDDASKQAKEYRTNILQTRSRVESSQEEMRNMLFTLDSEVESTRKELASVQQEKDDEYDQSIKSINELEDIVNEVPDGISSEIDGFKLDALSEIQDRKNNIVKKNREMDHRIDSVHSSLDKFDDANLKGSRNIEEMNDLVSDLSSVAQELVVFQSDLGGYSLELEQFKSELTEISETDPLALLAPLALQNIPTYVPNGAKEYVAKQGDGAKQIVQGLNIISLQTLYPTILLLITIFLSLIISTFSTLMHINSAAHQRLQTMPSRYFTEFFALYFSALILLFPPILVVLTIGSLVFQIPVFVHALPVIGALFLLSSTFIFLGISIARVIRKESVALILVTFLFVFLTFFSGFILPVERMRLIFYRAAELMPPKLALAAFKKSVFYGFENAVITFELITLVVWALGALLCLFLVKWYKLHYSHE